jgi:hypothetical protein
MQYPAVPLKKDAISKEAAGAEKEVYLDNLRGN